MAQPDDRLIQLSQDDERRVGKLAGYITIAAKIGEKYEKSKIKDLVEAVVPWSHLLGEVVPPLKILGFVLDRISRETDPVILGGLACTMAYEKAVKKALDESAGPERGFAEAKAELALLEPREEADMSTFSLDKALAHEFVRLADMRFAAGAQIAGYTSAQIERLTDKIHDLFRPSLDSVLADAETGKKLAPFREYLELGSPQRQEAFRALQQHLNYQRWLFEEAPVLGKSPFALRHVYVDTECGKLTWGEIVSRRKQRAEPGRSPEELVADPFSESFGGRHPLLETVMDLIAQPERELIIIQGVAGAGKSSFTLRLCQELRANYLRPIWVRVKDLDLTRHIDEALPAAVRLADERGRPTPAIARPDDLFTGGNLFSERGLGRFDQISRYVLILDAWDEISVSGEGFQQRVSRMLEQVRRTYLENRNPPLRVVMTGRPAREVTESIFLRDRTPILTIRPLIPGALRKYIGDIARAVRERPVAVESEQPESWPEFDPAKFGGILERYQKAFAGQSSEKPGEAALSSERSESGALAVLGLPLLAYLTIRLISEWQGDPGELVSNPTTLYRSLVDLTCEKAGKAEDAEDERGEIGGQHRVAGDRLRRLLQQTAAAMSVFGQDIISYDELKARLGLEGMDLEREVDEGTRERALSSLMISFYFKGGYEHLGCEFLHKSFREYLFAEAIVATLKQYGRDSDERAGALGRRNEYWRDFPPDDPRHRFSRRLSELLAPQWLTREVSRHVERLIEWEISRLDGAAAQSDPDWRTLDADGWARVRDGLADLWEWWGDGVHLRPQAFVERRKSEPDYLEPYVCELIEHSAPLAPKSAQARLARTATMDAHLGDGLCQLCALAHYHLAVKDGYRGYESERMATEETGRDYQRKIRAGQKEWVLFAPSGSSSHYFMNYAHRINAAGWRPAGDFPANTFLGAVVLAKVYLGRASLRRADLRYGILAEASLFLAHLGGAGLYRAILDGASLHGAVLDGASLEGASLDGASLSGASLYEAILNGASLERARLERARLDGARLVEADLAGANLYGASLYEASLDGAGLSKAVGLTWDQIDESRIDEDTRLPAEFAEKKQAKLLAQRPQAE
jgi:uncharacterized protein YjbI with pentapeptide repeats